MKKYIKVALIFAELGLCAGVYYREFSKFLGVTAQYTVLGQVHPHMIGLGVFGVLLIGLMNRALHIEGKQKSFLWYLVGISGMCGMLLVRGTLDILARANTDFVIGKALDASISGIAGLFHIAAGVGMVLLVRQWQKAAD